MRFASANKNTGGNIVNAGNAAGNAASDFLETARKNATDYTEMARTNVKAGYDMQSKAIQYDAETKSNKLKNEARVEGYDMEIDARIDANKEVRKAGMLAGFGKLAMAATKKRKKTTPPVESAPLTKAVPGEVNVEEKMEEWDKEHPMPTPRTVGGNTAKPDESTGTISAEGGGTSQTVASGSGGSYTKSDLYQLAIDQGIPKDQASTFAAIGIAESGGDATNDTVKSGLDPHKKNEYSVGLWQVNTKAHQNKLDARGWTVDDLRDPVKNATIAAEIYRESGGSFKPWGAYTNGSYKNHL